MKIRSLISISTLVVLAALLTGSPVSAQVVGGGLLLNGSFEGDYVSLSNFSDAQIAPSWFPWWVGRRGTEAVWSNRRPQFGASDTFVHSGNYAQRYATEFSTHQAGVLQQVNGAKRGDVLEFLVWARTWSSNLDHQCCSLQSGLVDLRVGIDPAGGTNPYASSVVWSAPVRSDDRWTQLSVRATAKGGTLTVFISSAPKYPVRHNEVYIDDARLIVVGREVMPAAEIPNPARLEDPFAITEPFAPSSEIVSGPLMYSVQPDDTLGEIANLFAVDVTTLADANGLGESDTIFVGDQLIIPGMSFVAPNKVARYTVDEGDTLEEIAAAFNTSVFALAQLNGIATYRVSPGTALLVPVEPGTNGDLEDTSGLTSHAVQADDT